VRAGVQHELQGVSKAWRRSRTLCLAQGFKLGLCAQPPVGLPHSLLALSNSCCIADTFEGLLARFNKLYRRR
jgi:hypothetical protein